jgi:hypothetical protein
MSGGAPPGQFFHPLKNFRKSPQNMDGGCHHHQGQNTKTVQKMGIPKTSILTTF